MSQTTSSSDLGNSTMDRNASMAHETIDRAKRLQEQAVHAAQDNVRRARSYIESNPLTTAGIAFAAGVLLSTLIRR
jgi:ElaB/YqjD/DUF883 family membrane-anchored ribosome-binding protein